MKKFTFTTTNPTGRYKAFGQKHHAIKFDKKEVGYITDGRSNDTYQIRLQVIKADLNEDNNPNCVWKWITLKKKSATLQEAKDWLNENRQAILEKYNLYYSED